MSAITHASSSASSGASGTVQPAAEPRNILGLSPYALLDDVERVVVDTLAGAMDAFEERVLRDTSGSPECVGAGVNVVQHKLVTMYNAVLDKFELYTMRNVMSVPDRVLRKLRKAEGTILPVSVNGQQPSADEEMRADAELMSLRKQLRGARSVQSQLSAERTQLTACLDIAKRVADGTSFVDDSQASAIAPILEQATKLQTLCAASRDADISAMNSTAADRSVARNEDSTMTEPSVMLSPFDLIKKSSQESRLSSMYEMRREEIDTGTPSGMAALTQSMVAN